MNDRNEYDLSSLDNSAVGLIQAQIATWTGRPDSARRTRTLARLAADLVAAQGELEPAQDAAREVIAAQGEGGGVTQVTAGAGIEVDDTEPSAPVIALGAGSMVWRRLSFTVADVQGSIHYPDGYVFFPIALAAGEYVEKVAVVRGANWTRLAAAPVYLIVGLEPFGGSLSTAFLGGEDGHAFDLRTKTDKVLNMRADAGENTFQQDITVASTIYATVVYGIPNLTGGQADLYVLVGKMPVA